MKRLLIPAMVLSIMLITPLTLSAQAAPDIDEQIRHELVMMPYYQIFDWINFETDGNTVTLLGEVTRPVLKSDAEKTVKRIAGVKQVINKIEVLPYSPYDDRIRISVYRAVYANPNFTRYAIRANGPIHIIVNNGDVRLMGSVLTKTDKNIAGIITRGVEGVFTVTNDLLIGV
jgi:osmotically-inducible protein OsmY